MPRKVEGCYLAPSLGTDDEDFTGTDGSTSCSVKMTAGDYCHGCKQFVCRNHDVNLGLTGRHSVMEHLKNDRDDIDAPPDDDSESG